MAMVMSDLIVAVQRRCISSSPPGDMAAADAADGTIRSQVIQVANALAQPGSFQFYGWRFANSASGLQRQRVLGTSIRDSKDDILVTRSGSSEAHLIAARDFHDLNATNGIVECFEPFRASQFLGLEDRRHGHFVWRDRILGRS